MEAWIKDFFKGFTGGIAGLFMILLTVAIWGVVLSGSWWLFLTIVKAVIVLFTGIFL